MKNKTEEQTFLEFFTGIIPSLPLELKKVLSELLNMDKTHFESFAIQFILQIFAATKLRPVETLYDTEPFERALRSENYSENTITAYRYAVRDFYARLGRMDKANLLCYKAFLSSQYNPKTVNLRIQGLNKFLSWSGQEELKLKVIKMPKAAFVENVISKEDYLFFKQRLSEERDPKWYFIVWFLAATGVRISELIQFKVEHVQAGHFDIYGKGGKMRRIYLTRKLQKEALKWLKDRGSGYLFLNKKGERISPRGIANRLKAYAAKYGMNTEVVHPHSFRHLYAKSFLEKEKDPALLADLLGHESLETTRIYLRKSSREQREFLNRIVDW